MPRYIYWIILQPSWWTIVLTPIYSLALAVEGNSFAHAKYTTCVSMCDCRLCVCLQTCMYTCTCTWIIPIHNVHNDHHIGYTVQMCCITRLTGILPQTGWSCLYSTYAYSFFFSVASSVWIINTGSKYDQSLKLVDVENVQFSIFFQSCL